MAEHDPDRAKGPVLVILVAAVLGLSATIGIGAYAYASGGSYDGPLFSGGSGHGGNNPRVDTEDWMKDLAAPAIRDDLADTCAVMVLPVFDFEGLHEEDVEQLNCIIRVDVLHPETGEEFDVFAVDIISDPGAVSQAAVLPVRLFEELPVTAEPVEPGHRLRVVTDDSSQTVYDIQEGGIARYTLYNTPPEGAEPFLRAVGLIH